MTLPADLFGANAEAYLLGTRGDDIGQRGEGQIEWSVGLSPAAREHLAAAIAFLVPLLRSGAFRECRGRIVAWRASGTGLNPPHPGPALRPHPLWMEGVRRMEIEVRFPGGKQVEAVFGNYVVRTDQPVSSGGGDSAPSPYDTFLASLATCAGIFALQFCQSRNLPVEGLALRQRIEWDRERNRLARVSIDVTAPIGFPEKYLEALRRAADQCKVKRVMLDPPEFEVTAHLSPV